MDENLHDIDDLFKKAINEHDESPSESVWENIDRNLDKKKVVFISKKYNKLKWIAAALLMFSAGMAMYTWHTKLTNKELVKQNSAGSKKQISTVKPGNDIKDIDSNTAKTAKAKNKAPVKDITDKVLPENAASLSHAGNTNVFKEGNKNRNNIEATKAQKDENLKKENVTDLAANADNYKEQTERRLMRIKTSNSKNSVIYEKGQKGIKMILPYKNQNNTPTVAVEELTKTRKEVAAEIETRKNDFTIPTANSSLQNSLEKLSQNRNKLRVNESNSLLSVKINKKAFKKSLFAATVFFSPDIVAKKIDDDHHRFMEDDRDEIKNKEEVKASYSAGILINYNAFRKMSIESGVIFSALSTDIQPKLIYARPDDQGNINYRFNCSSGYSYIPRQQAYTLANGDSATASASTNVLHYISVPLTLKYHAEAGKFSVSPGLGVAFNFLTKAKIETAIKGAGGDEKLSLSHIEGLNSMYLNSALSVGLSYGINKNMALSLTPGARFALTSINKNTPVKTFINSYGFAAGLTIKL